MKNKYISILLVLILLAVVLSGCAGKVQYTWDNGTAYSDTGNAANAGKSYFVFTNATSILKLDVDKNDLTVFYPAKPSAARQFHAAPEVVDIDSGNDPQVIVGDYSGLLESVSFKDASSNWQFAKAQGKYIASTLTVGKTVIAANTDGFIYFINLTKPENQSRWMIESVTSYPAKDGKANTLDTTGVPSAGLPDFWAAKPKSGFDNYALAAFWSTPVTDGTTVYAPNIDHKVYAVDIASGKDKWPAVELSGAIVADPILVDTTLYVGTLDNQMYAIDVTSGKVLPSWPVKLSGGIWSKPVFKDGKLFCGDNSGTITILDAISGKSIDFYATKSAILGSGVDTGGKVLFGTDNGNIYAVGTDNQVQKWGDAVTGQFHSSLVFDGKYVLALAQNGDATFYVFDLDGNRVQIDTSALK